MSARHPSVVAEARFGTTGAAPAAPSGPTGAVRGAASGEDATASLLLPGVLWITMVAAIVLIDIGAYLVAAARAQALADAAALAAVSVDLPEQHGRPAREAERVAEAGDGRLEDCACRRGSGDATVEVSVAVPGVLVPSLGAQRVTATATATLVP